MRGEINPQSSFFSYVDLESRIPQHHPIRKIRSVVDHALEDMQWCFDEMYSRVGRPSIPPEQLVRALLLQIVFTIRSERQLMERLDYDLMFRWFVGLGIDDTVWNHSVFSKNRDRLMLNDVDQHFFDAVKKQAYAKQLMSREHFSVDGTLLEACASMKSFKPKDIVTVQVTTSTDISAATRHTSPQPIVIRACFVRVKARNRSSIIWATC